MPGSSPANRYSHALTNFLLDAAGGPGHELPSFVIDEEDGCGVASQNLEHAVEQLDEKVANARINRA